MPSSGRCTTVASPPWRLMHGAKRRAISSRTLQLSIAPPIVAWLVGDIAAVADDDGDAGQLFEIGGRYGVGGQRPERADGLHRLWCLIFGEYESAARLVGHYGAYVRAFDGCMPARPSALGVGDKDAAARFVHQRGHVRGYQPFVVRARIGRHLAEELFQCLCRSGELAALVVMGPHAHAEILEPELIVGRGFDGLVGCAAPGASAAWLVDQVCAETAAEEQGGEPFPPVGVLSHVLADCPAPCRKTRGILRASAGIW